MTVMKLVSFLRSDFYPLVAALVAFCGVACLTTVFPSCSAAAELGFRAQRLVLDNNEGCAVADINQVGMRDRSFVNIHSEK